MKLYIIALKESKQMFEFETEEKRTNFIKDLQKKDKDIEYATSEVEE